MMSSHRSACCRTRHAQRHVAKQLCPSRRGRVGSSQLSCRATSHHPGALILEADGVVSDIHMDGHRVAFNKAFHDLGFDCTNWTPAIYHDLLAKGDGTGEGLVSAYFSTVGWPTFLPTSEQAMFAGKVHDLKQQQLGRMLHKGQVPLRDGIAQVMSEAVAAGAKIAVIAHTASQSTDDVIGCIMAQLPADVAGAVRVYSTSTYSQPQDEDEGSGEQGTSDSDSSSSSSIESGMAAAATRVKQKGAQEFVQRMASALEGKQAGVALTLDHALQKAGSTNPTNAAWLAAVAATLAVPASSCVAVASSIDLINAASAAGMVPIAVPRKMAYAASYPAAAAKFEGFGPGYATYQKLAGVWRQQQ